MSSDEAPKSRRRGPALELAILESAWEELIKGGYQALTLEAVASRAHTSRSVLARRWDGRVALTVSALRHQMAKHPLDVQACGDVRAELIEYLAKASKRLRVLPVIFSLLNSEIASPTTLQELRAALIDGERDVMVEILMRAFQRGQISSRALEPAVSELLDVLFRHHALMTQTAPSEELRRTWVDNIFLPLVSKELALYEVAN